LITSQGYTKHKKNKHNENSKKAEPIIAKTT